MFLDNPFCRTGSFNSLNGAIKVTLWTQGTKRQFGGFNSLNGAIKDPLLLSMQRWCLSFNSLNGAIKAKQQTTVYRHGSQFQFLKWCD